MGLFGKRKSYVNCFYELSSFKVKDIMTKDVVCIHRGDKLVDAAHTMIGAHVSCLVVLEGATPVGIITERDFIKKLTMTEDSSEKMIVNDIITLGALPISLAMHLAVGESKWFGNEARIKNLIQGWQRACHLSRCTWAGGESPTLKDIIAPGSILLSGSATGIIKPKVMKL